MTRRRLTTAVLLAATLATVTAVPAAAAASGAPDEGQDGVQRHLDLLVERDGVPGALAFTGSTTYTAGTAELGSGQPMTGAEGRVRIASNTKSFTAAAVMRLVTEGRLRLDETAARHVPQLAGSPVTVRQLLMQTSGLPDYVGLMDWAATGSTPEEHLALALTQERVFEPGTDWGYSNTNYLVLGMIINQVTGEDFRTYIEETILRPLELDDTYWPEAGELALRGPHAHNYGINPADPEAGVTDVTELPGYEFGAAGGLVSTPGDLNTFWNALFGGELLPRWAVWLMTHDTTDVGNRGLYPAGSRYGYGLTGHALSCGGMYWGHGGDLPGGSVAGGHASGHRGTVTVYTTTQATEEATRARLNGAADAALCPTDG
ncbi:serine hydrolase domain-containing protein [Streptomyces sp. MP131-18]|uniref:serine hydrolase domain-containing protein n=1 Tax=Streptomyces sp. MP131-18 TaxID=1857892 RepID=UPI00097C0E70|nr:serine hydrolase domain-containing protein [Streptomyces sp. MP131-18]ONK11683.1 D-alanyl-D-alanine carboxypeptidase precursor [Streptomyces sp. MP131-18]